MVEEIAGQLPELAESSRFLNSHQVISLLKVSRTTLHNLIMRVRNPIPSVKIGKTRRFPLDKLRVWMERPE